MSRLALVALALLLAGNPAAGDNPGADPTSALDAAFGRAVITVEGRMACHRIAVWLALDAAQRARGLMHVSGMADDRGMLFLYPGERRVSMWMKNTLIPLDMVFIRADGTVANVASNTEPLSLESVYSRGPVGAVLELNAGVAARLGVERGRRIYVGQAVQNGLR
ncbi:DUF192 domain-containing protein [Lentisalinibacter orientalis]|uniref:DUF192 domain-containing protein n=1 Tax=Lentisalinibacter orientalis TaxID=2992241 RepID=UPI00386955A9